MVEGLAMLREHSLLQWVFSQSVGIVHSHAEHQDVNKEPAQMSLVQLTAAVEIIRKGCRVCDL